MGVFRFRKFEVRNEKSAMKVNTDGVLLGALMTITGNERRLLDIGTGTGTIALMAAQRLAGMAAAMSRRGKTATPELDVTEPSGPAWSPDSMPTPRSGDRKKAVL